MPSVIQSNNVKVEQRYVWLNLDIDMINIGKDIGGTILIHPRADVNPTTLNCREIGLMSSGIGSRVRSWESMLIGGRYILFLKVGLR